MRPEDCGVVDCSKCGTAMLRAEMYDPEGTVPLYGDIRKGESWWVCINRECEDGRRNTERERRQHMIIPTGIINLAAEATSNHTDGWTTKAAREKLLAIRDYINRVLKAG